MKKLSVFFFSFLLVSGLLISTASGAEWRLVNGQGSLSFSGTQLGQPFEGRFEDFSAVICFEETALEGAYARLDINTASAATGIPDRDEILAAEEWLNPAEFPAAMFETADIKRVGPNAYVANGTLTIKGVPRAITLPFILDLVENTASGELTIDRRDFGIGDGEWGRSEKWVGYQIVIKFDIAAQMTERDCEQ